MHFLTDKRLIELPFTNGDILPLRGGQGPALHGEHCDRQGHHLRLSLRDAFSEGNACIMGRPGGLARGSAHR